MSDATPRPVLFFAFAQDRTDGGAYLRNLPVEQEGIRNALQKARQAGLCDLEVRSNSTIENIFSVFQEYADRIAIFHYGGHADSYELLLETATGGHALTHSDGLVPFLARQKGLQLVFLNGCSSQQQAEDLIHAGVPAVIGTSRVIDDDVATRLSGRFYAGLAAGLPVARAWAEAVDAVKTERGNSTTRGVKGVGGTPVTDRFPWEIYYRAGAEIVRDWNLPDAVENPLFGLPEIPPTQDLPETPFLFLKRYERAHAEIFFGRSYCIRELYQRIKDAKSDPLILLYGQSGVGKSSLFDAGLNPRLESEFTVVYQRRISERGLTGTLALALARALTKLGPEPTPSVPAAVPDSAATESATRQKAIDQLQTVAAALEEPAVRQEIEALIARLVNPVPVPAPQPGPTNTTLASSDGGPGIVTPETLRAQWQQIEARTGRPLVVILDQVEELFTRPNLDLPKELEDFVAALSTILGTPAQRPRGKLLLGYRKEYHPEIEEACKNCQLPRARVFLESLRKKDILDIFHGLTRTPALKARYNLTVEEDLPVMITDDLLADPHSPVAPVLQILLTDLWNGAREANPTAPRFIVSQYQQLRQRGTTMSEFFARQMALLGERQRDVVDSGLALEILHDHTTDLGTAGTRSREELRRDYAHRQEVLDPLITDLKELYLLTEVAQGTEQTSLTHDTLAPVVQRAHQLSCLPGQRARRILDGKKNDLGYGAEVFVVLDEGDYNTVQAGKPGTRRITAGEAVLLDRSQATMKRRRRELEEALARAVALRLVSEATAMLNGDRMGCYERALHQLLAARQLDPNSKEVSGALFATASQLDPNLSRLADAGPLGSVGFCLQDAVLVTAGLDGFLRFWDATSGQLLGQPLPVDDKLIYDVAYSADGWWIATVGWSPVRLWKLDPENPPGKALPSRVHELSTPDTFSTAVAFSPEGSRLVAGDAGGQLHLWDVQSGQAIPTGKTHAPLGGGAIRSVAFNRDGTRIASGGDDGVVRVWDAATLQLLGQSAPDFSTSIRRLTFNPNGARILVAESAGSAHRPENSLRLYDPATCEAVGELKGHQGKISTVTFRRDGMLCASGGDDGNLRIWDAESGRLMHSLRGHLGSIASVTFGADGASLISGGEDGCWRLWVPGPDPNHNPSIPVEGPIDDTISGPMACLSSDGCFVVTYAMEGSALWLWPLGGGAGNQIGPAVSGNNPVVVAFDHNVSRVACAARDGSLHLWDRASGRRQQIRSPEAAVAVADGGLAVSPDGSWVIAVGGDRSLWLWDEKSAAGRILQAVTEIATAPILVVAFSPDGRQLAAGTSDGQIQLWDMVSGQCTAVLKAFNNAIDGLAYTPDGTRILVIGIADGGLQQWDLATQTRVGPTLRGKFTRVSHSPDGEYLVAGGLDGSVQLLDGRTAQPLSRPIGGGDGRAKITRLSVTPDGRLIVSLDELGDLRVWPGPLAWVEAVTAVLTRNMTRAQWNDWVSPQIEYQVQCSELPVPEDPGPAPPPPAANH